MVLDGWAYFLGTVLFYFSSYRAPKLYQLQTSPDGSVSLPSSLLILSFRIVFLSSRMPVSISGTEIITPPAFLPLWGSLLALNTEPAGSERQPDLGASQEWVYYPSISLFYGPIKQGGCGREILTSYKALHLHPSVLCSLGLRHCLNLS